MRWLRLFGAQIVVISEPYPDGDCWQYIFGDEKTFQLRRFASATDARNNHRTTLAGLGLGAPEISVRLIKLDPDQARSLVLGEVSYQQLIESRL